MSTSSTFMSTATLSSGTGCAGQITCAQKGFDCGMIGDGCGGLLDCGTCTKAGDTCGGNNMPNVCGQPPCTPKTCAGLGFNCGMTSDGCNGTLDCGMCQTGQICGGGGANKCGTVTCTPKTFAQACTTPGLNCGLVSDGCSGTIDCSGGVACPTGTSCGGGGVSNKCGAPVCTPKTCAQQNFNCGMATDGCNGIIDCGPVTNCMAPQVCGGTSPNQCGIPANCTGLCLQQQTCPMGGTTSISGTVFAPNGTDPLYNTLVYVPNGGPAPTYGVQPIAPGVHCGQCGDDVSGSPLVSTVTDVHGKFTLNNMPVGMNIPIVIQNGRWRRKMTISNVPACVNTALPTTGSLQLRMPRTEGESDPADNIPLMGFVTGSVDALECVLRKIGISDTAFSDPSGAGRVRFYQGSGGPGATYSGSTPPEDVLWGSQAEINKYDMVYFACQGGEYLKTAANQKIVETYANSGGRVFGTHYAYVWLANNTGVTPPATASFQSTAQWNSPVDQLQNFTSDPELGYIDTTFPRGLALAQWLQGIGATTTQGQISIQTLRDNFHGVNAPSLDWIYLKDANYPGSGTPTNPAPKPMHYTFNTPVGAMPANQCGRVLYDDFHVENQSFFLQPTFPSECTVMGMTPQEKMLEFMIFDLGSCVTPSTCTPKTCMAQGAQCGPIGDGCGAIEQCGTCPTGQFCVSNKCVGCTPKTCLQQNFMCGTQGDGCGGSENCGTCPVGQNCINGMCVTGTCTPKTCAQQNFTCGAQGDGCGNIIMCGGCGANQTCTNGSCTNVSCIPKTCAQQGFNCGSASDGCNGILNCGTCMNGQTCGGGINPMANVCGGGAA